MEKIITGVSHSPEYWCPMDAGPHVAENHPTCAEDSEPHDLFWNYVKDTVDVVSLPEPIVHVEWRSCKE